MLWWFWIRWKYMGLSLTLFVILWFWKGILGKQMGCLMNCLCWVWFLMFVLIMCVYGLCKQNSVEAGIKMIGSIEELRCKVQIQYENCFCWVWHCLLYNVVIYNIILDTFSKAGSLLGSRMRKLVRDGEIRVLSSTFGCFGFCWNV